MVLYRETSLLGCGVGCICQQSGGCEARAERFLKDMPSLSWFLAALGLGFRVCLSWFFTAPG